MSKIITKHITYPDGNVMTVAYVPLPHELFASPKLKQYTMCELEFLDFGKPE